MEKTEAIALLNKKLQEQSKRSDELYDKKDELKRKLGVFDLESELRKTILSANTKKQADLKEKLEKVMTPELNAIQQELDAIGIISEYRISMRKCLEGKTEESNFFYLYQVIHDIMLPMIPKIKDEILRKTYIHLYCSFEDWERQLMEDIWNSQKQKCSQK